MKEGFTLIELLGVIALLGIIVLVAVPSLIQANKESKERELKAFEETLNIACQSYVEVHSHDGFEEIDNLLKYGTPFTNSGSILIDEGYLKKDFFVSLYSDSSVNITMKKKNNKIVCDHFSAGED